MEKRRGKNSMNTQEVPISKKARSNSKEEDEVLLMQELAMPILERYNSELLNKNLKIAIESSKAVKRDEVIKLKSNLEILPFNAEYKDSSPSKDTSHKKKRKLSLFDNKSESIYSLT